MEVVEHQWRVMGSESRLTVVGGPPGTLQTAVMRLEDLEARWSRFVAGSDVARLNLAEGRPVAVHPDTLTLMDASITAWNLTAGQFDPTVLGRILERGDLVDIVDGPGLYSQSITSRLGCGEIVVDVRRNEITMPVGVGFDPGGIGKGLAADLVVKELIDAGAAGAMVSVGGDLCVDGAAPGETWQVVVEDPWDPVGVVAVLKLARGGVATSSKLARRLADGSSHIVNPHGANTFSAVSTTVIAGAAWLAEGFAKAALLAGSASGPGLLERGGVEGLVVSDTGVVTLSGGMAQFL